MSAAISWSGCDPCRPTHRTDNPPFPWVMHRQTTRYVPGVAGSRRPCGLAFRTWSVLHRSPSSSSGCDGLGRDARLCSVSPRSDYLIPSGASSVQTVPLCRAWRLTNRRQSTEAFQPRKIPRLRSRLYQLIHQTRLVAGRVQASLSLRPILVELGYDVTEYRARAD